MQKERYDYTAQSRRESIDYNYRPLVDVQISSKTKSRRFKALVDSGTEITVMDEKIAQLLGIDSSGYPKAHLSGIEEWREGFIAPVSLQIERFEEVFSFQVLFIEDLGKNFDIILGQQDFFRNFNVSFERHHNLFFLERVIA